MSNIWGDDYLFSDNYPTMTFQQTFNSAEDFLKDAKDVGIPLTITEENCTLLYYLLYAKYGNSHFAGTDLHKNKVRIFALVFQHGQTWQKELEIQKKLRELTTEELMKGASMINNHALNPSTAPKNDTWDGINKTDEQSIQHHKRGVIEAYGALEMLLKRDVTEEFLNRFDGLFIQFLLSSEPLLYFTNRPNIPINHDKKGRKQ